MSEKLDMLNLPKEERKKAEEKFLATLALVTVEELREILNLLRENGIYITKAREIKVLANTKEEILKKFNILKELGEIVIYKQDPTKINFNVIDVYKKVQYCKQIGVPYKKEDGTYESFLFDEGLWQQVAAKSAEPTFTPVEDIVTLTPDVAPINFVEETVSIVDDTHQDIQEYMANDTKKEEMEAQTTTFNVIQDEIEAQQLDSEMTKLSQDRKALEDFQKQLSELDTISFDDLDFGSESFGGR